MAASPCYNTTSSNCVSNQGTKKDKFSTQTEINDFLLKFADDVKSQIDVSKLNTNGTDITPLYSLLNVIQYLIDKSKTTSTTIPEISADNIQIAIDLKCLSGSCNTSSYSLTALMQIFLDKMCSLESRVETLNNKLF